MRHLDAPYPSFTLVVASEVFGMCSPDCPVCHNDFAHKRKTWPFAVNTIDNNDKHPYQNVLTTDSVIFDEDELIMEEGDGLGGYIDPDTDDTSFDASDQAQTRSAPTLVEKASVRTLVEGPKPKAVSTLLLRCLQFLQRKLVKRRRMQGLTQGQKHNLLN